MSFFHMVRVFVFFTIRINKIAIKKLYLKGLVIFRFAFLNIIVEYCQLLI
jgi:hypothetical protein